MPPISGVLALTNLVPSVLIETGLARRFGSLHRHGESRLPRVGIHMDRRQHGPTSGVCGVVLLGGGAEGTAGWRRVVCRLQV
jgi:hypothetical protein